MNISAYRHNIKWDTRIGDWTRKVVTWLGIKSMAFARRCFKWSLGRCSYCGKDPGFASSVSRKGLRCSTLERDCTDY